MKWFFSVILVTYSPRKDVVNGPDPVGKFFLADAQERFMKNVRVVSKRVPSHPAAGRKKFIAALHKSGYWVPEGAWENCLFGGAVDAVLARDQKPKISTEVSLPCLGAACHMFAFRYTTGRLLIADALEASRCLLVVLHTGHLPHWGGVGTHIYIFI